MALKPQQQEALAKITSFIKDTSNQVFILKGYAGTGKTTLLAKLYDHIKEMDRYPLLLAPTGRAAKVLRDKTNHGARTIHSTIYSRGRIKSSRYDENGVLIGANSSDDQATDNIGIDRIEYFYGLKDLSEIKLAEGIPIVPQKTVILIDESSLISSKTAANELLHFGTDNILDDLLTFAKPQLGTKLIFIGDPAQLPPVGDNQSNALNEEYFKEKGLMVQSTNLTDVLRQAGEGAILKNAMKIRDLLNQETRNNLTFECRKGEFEEITSEEAIQRYLDTQPSPKIGESIIVCFSNALVKEYNDRIRQHYFPGKPGIQEGDILQIIKKLLFSHSR